MPALISILPLLRNPWVLLLIASLAGVAGTSWYRMKYHNLVAAQATAIAEAQKRADALANELIIAQAAAMAATERTVTVYRDRIIHAPVTNTCGPVVRDAARGVCATLGGSPDAKCGTVAPVH